MGYSTSSEIWAFLRDVQLNKSKYDQYENPGISKHVPYTCPIVPCGRLVSPSCSLTHFALDHIKIDISEVNQNRQYVLTAIPWKISFSDVKCLAVLKVFEEVDFISSGTITQSEFDGSEDEKGTDFVVCATMVAKFQYGSEEKDDGLSMENCFLLVWSSCLFSDIQMAVRIEARHPAKSWGTSLMYEGPVKSIYASQKPSDIFRSGDCLTIPFGLLKCLVDHDQGLQIIVTYFLLE